jgi:cytochrome c biogenesis protein CcmG, thiol:disulfide interchange protein DsbE
MLPLMLAGLLLAAPHHAPKTEVRLADGSSWALSSFTGKVVLIDFWASWCGPCKKSFPALDELFREYHDRGLEVLAVNVDEDRRDADAFLEGRPHRMPITFDAKGVLPRAFSVEGMPSSFLIDKSGAIRYTHMGYSEKTLASVRDEIEELLREDP